MHASRIVGIAALILLAACSHHAPIATVEVLDTSMSITPRAEHAAENAIADQISRIGRGDRLILIPITGDAQNDAGGKILRLVAPTERQAYDNDLRQFQADAKKRYTAWAASLNSHQMQTDILGTLDLARQELAAMPKDSDRRLIILSDFLEDEPSYRFVSSPQLTSAPRARALAATLRPERAFALRSIPVCLGRLESRDFAPLSPQRKEAVQAFWIEYLRDESNVPDVRFDGTGLLTDEAGCVTTLQGMATTRQVMWEDRP